MMNDGVVVTYKISWNHLYLKVYELLVLTLCEPVSLCRFLKNSSFLALCNLSGISKKGECELVKISPMDSSMIFNPGPWRDTVRLTAARQCLPAIWVRLNPVTWTPRSHHHITVPRNISNVHFQNQTPDFSLSYTRPFLGPCHVRGAMATSSMAQSRN